MKRLALGACALLAAVTFGTLALLQNDTPSASAVGESATISIGTTSFASNQLTVPINVSGVTDAYAGFNIHLLFDSSVYTFASANSTGTTIPSPFCPAAAVDADSNGVVFACTSLGGPTSANGLLGTIVLNATGTGCSNLHLMTRAEASNAGLSTSSYGTYLVNDGDFSEQNNQIGADVTADETGATGCTPTQPTATPIPATNTPVPATATNTPGGPTNTPVPATATNTPSSGSTATPILRTVTPTTTPVTPTVAPTNTPGVAPTQPGGGGAGGQATPTKPGGGQGAGITGPNTGTGDSAGSGHRTLYLLLAAAMLIAGGGAAYSWWRRERAR